MCDFYFSMHRQAGRVGRVDCFVQSLDKNFMVPIGGSVVAAFEPTLIDAISKNYPGRASISSVIDLFITLLSMGANKFKEMLQQREVQIAFDTFFKHVLVL
jgi:O-phospho-L-seryl-tRNASec:L-selenocysteinyl-tRNA synthase